MTSPSKFDVCIKETSEGLVLSILATPRASKSKIVGEHDGRLKVALKAPPVDGAANQELVDFLAKCLALPKRDIRLVSGESGRRKSVVIANLSRPKLIQMLESIAS